MSRFLRFSCAASRWRQGHGARSASQGCGRGEQGRAVGAALVRLPSLLHRDPVSDLRVPSPCPSDRVRTGAQTTPREKRCRRLAQHTRDATHKGATANLLARSLPAVFRCSWIPGPQPLERWQDGARRGGGGGAAARAHLREAGRRTRELCVLICSPSTLHTATLSEIDC